MKEEQANTLLITLKDLLLLLCFNLPRQHIIKLRESLSNLTYSCRELYIEQAKWQASDEQTEEKGKYLPLA